LLAEQAVSVEITATVNSHFFINYPFVEMADYMNLLRFVDTKRLSFKFVLL